jgi:hypothetical protein
MTGVALIINRVERFGPGNEWPPFSPDGRWRSTRYRNGLDVLTVKAGRL